MWKDDVYSGTKTDKADELSSFDVVARLFPTYHAARNEPSDLFDYHAHSLTVDSKYVLFVGPGSFLLKSGLEFASFVFEILQFPLNGGTIYMDVKDIQENANLVPRSSAFHFCERRNLHDFAVGGRDHQVISLGNFALGVAKEVTNVAGQDNEDYCHARKVKVGENYGNQK